MNFNQLSSSKKVLQIISKCNWKIEGFYPWRLRIKNGTAIADLYWNAKQRLKLCTIIHHPRRGRNQLYRKLNSVNELEKFLINPRQHSKKGYGSNKYKNGKSR